MRANMKLLFISVQEIYQRSTAVSVKKIRKICTLPEQEHAERKIKKRKVICTSISGGKYMSCKKKRHRGILQNLE
jgi:hypothetical protein